MPLEVFALGSNGSGQLGIGHMLDVSIPTKSLLLPVTQSHPTAVAAGGNHTILRFSDGTVYAAGANEDGRCCKNRPTNKLLDFNHVQVSERRQLVAKFSLCSATWEATTLVTLENRVFTCGSGSKGELGLGINSTTATVPQLLYGFPPTGTDVVDISACVSHTIAVLSNGDVYGWGSGRKGQLGEPCGIIWSPRKVEGLGFKAIRAVCGREFSFIVGSSESGDHIVLGSDKWSVKSSAPTSVANWKDIAASWGTIFVLQSDGCLRSWGRNDHGQLPPKALTALRSVKAGSEHVVAETVAGDIVAWGWGEHGNCGTSILQNGGAKDGYNVICQDRSSYALGGGCATTWIIKETKDE